MGFPLLAIATDLDMPVSTNVVAFSVTGGYVTIGQEKEAGPRLAIEMKLPCVIGADWGLNGNFSISSGSVILLQAIWKFWNTSPFSKNAGASFLRAGPRLL